MHFLATGAILKLFNICELAGTPEWAVSFNISSRG